MKNDKIHKIHAPKIQGRAFSGNKSACGSDHTDAKGLGTLKSMNIDKIHKIKQSKGPLGMLE